MTLHPSKNGTVLSSSVNKIRFLECGVGPLTSRPNRLELFALREHHSGACIILSSIWIIENILRPNRLFFESKRVSSKSTFAEFIIFWLVRRIPPSRIKLNIRQKEIRRIQPKFSDFLGFSIIFGPGFEIISPRSNFNRPHPNKREWTIIAIMTSNSYRSHRKETQRKPRQWARENI